MDILRNQMFTSLFVIILISSLACKRSNLFIVLWRLLILALPQVK